MKEAGVDLDDGSLDLTAIEGRVIHGHRDGSAFAERHRYGRVDETLKAVSRGQLNERLRGRIAESYPKVRVVKGASIGRVDIEGEWNQS